MFRKTTLSLILAWCFHCTSANAHHQYCAIPYHEEFGSGQLDACWHTESYVGSLRQSPRLRANPPGRITVTNRYQPITPTAEPYHLILDDPRASISIIGRRGSSNAALLYLDLSGQQYLKLEFKAKLYSNDDLRQPARIYLSDDAGQTFRSVHVLPVVGPFHKTHGKYIRYRLNLDQLAAGANLTFNNRFVVGFEHVSDDRIPADGMTIDYVNVDYHLFPIPTTPESAPSIPTKTIACPVWQPNCEIPVPPTPPCTAGPDCPHWR